jgi:hypothetical protein
MKQEKDESVRTEIIEISRLEEKKVVDQAAIRKSKLNELDRRNHLCDISVIRAHMSIETCGKNKGFLAKCCNNGLCRSNFLNPDVKKNQDLELICQVSILRNELYPVVGGPTARKKIFLAKLNSFLHELDGQRYIKFSVGGKAVCKNFYRVSVA